MLVETELRSLIHKVPVNRRIYVESPVCISFHAGSMKAYDECSKYPLVLTLPLKCKEQKRLTEGV